MAFDFLSSPSDASVLNEATGNSSGINNISNILNLIGAGSGIANTFRGYQPTSAEGGQGQSIANVNELLKAYLDPNSTIYKNVMAGQQQQLNNQTQQGLSDLMSAQRKAQIMGRGTYFNPERQDESISQYLSNQATSNANTARSNALQQILSAASGYNSQAGNYAKMIPGQQAAQAKNNNALPTGLNQISNMLPLLMQIGTMF